MSSHTPPTRRIRPLPLLLIQLVVANIIVAGVVALVLYFTFDNLTETYFGRLMDEFKISPTKLNSMFVDDVERSLFWGIGIALVVGIGLSLLLTNAVLRPLRKMASASETIAEGDFSARAPEMSGELGTLARRFNSMAATLELEETRRRQLLRDLSHEIRTPLTNLKGYLEAVSDGVFQPGPEVFSVLRGEVERLNALVDDLTSLSAAEDIADNLELSAVDLGDAVRHAVAVQEPVLKEKGLAVDIVQEGTATPVRADRKRLNQVLNNALANLVQYADCSANSSATITLDYGGSERAEISFDNPARPIPQNDLVRLFDRFYRADPSRAGDGRRNGHNAGLGLAIVKRLVEAHDGAVRVEQADGRFRLIINWPLAVGTRNA